MNKNDSTIKHISPSMLGMYEKCGEQFRRRYVMGEKIPPGISLVIGRGVDTAVSDNMVAKRDTGSLLSIDAVKERSFKAVSDILSTEEVRPEADYEGLSTKNIHGIALDSAVALTELHSTNLAPTIEPVYVQEKMTAEVIDLPVPLLGIIDLTDKQGRIRDTKTTTRSKQQSEADDSQQLTAYQYLYTNKTGEPPTSLQLDVLVRTPTGQLKTQVINSEIRETGKMNGFINRLHAAYDGIMKGAFRPAPEGAWWCSPKWCGYYTSCRYIK